MAHLGRDAPDPAAGTAADTAWSVALIVWATRAADRIAAAECAASDRPRTAGIRPVVPAAPLPARARPVPDRSGAAVPFGGSAA